MMVEILNASKVVPKARGVSKERKLLYLEV